MPPTPEQVQQYRFILQAYRARLRSIVATHKVTVRRALKEAEKRRKKNAEA